MIASDKLIDPAHAGNVALDGQLTEPPFLLHDPMFGQLVGIHIRKYVTDYDRIVRVRYDGALDTKGNELGAFEFDLRIQKRKQPGEVWPEHDMIVLQAARESAVLLKNENHALPLGSGQVVNAFGAGAVVYRGGCLGAGKINPRYAIRIKEGIIQYSSLRLNDELYDFYRDEKNILPTKEVLTRAKKLSDTAVLFISRTSSEAHDNRPLPGEYYLAEEEKLLLSGVRKFFGKLVVVLNEAYLISMKWTEDIQPDALLYVGLPGMAGGRALAEILEGKVCPSGKLPCTWAYDYYDHPSAKNFITDERKAQFGNRGTYATVAYEEGMYVGYRYFDSFDVPVAYPFGFGQSYTNFASTCISCVIEQDVLHCQVTVKNTGNYAGKEVVQLYAKYKGGTLEQPKRRLVAFGKTKQLEPGEEEQLDLNVDEQRLRSFSEDLGSFVLEKGEIAYYLGEENIFIQTVPETKILKKAGARLPTPITLTVLSAKDPKGTYPTGKYTGVVSSESFPFPTQSHEEFPEEEVHREEKSFITFPQLRHHPELVTNFVAQFTDAELARISVGRKTGWGYGESGYAGMLYQCGILQKYELPEYYFADGNNGINITETNIGFPVSSLSAPAGTKH